MKNVIKGIFALFFLFGSISNTYSQGIMVGYDNDVVDIAISSDDHSTLVAAVRAAGLVEVLKGEGPFTIFAPTNAAFAKLPQGTVSTLLQPENKDALTGILTYHVVAGKLDASNVLKAIHDNNGSIELKTINGAKFTAKLWEGNVVLKDGQGNKAIVIATDLIGTNGIIHVIDSVILP
ncbi:MAG TPA: fasciclin domain-containing protein [Saprospiraceae bacterium]|nr:fasciclin domain-containing protein [Saprospiraceae bacterium]